MPATYKKLARYVAPDGKEFESLNGEQEHEIACMVPDDNERPTTPETMAAWIVGNKAALVACLNQRERKNVSAKAATPRKPRARKTTATPATEPTA